MIQGLKKRFLKGKYGVCGIHRPSTYEAKELGNLLKEYGWQVELEKCDGFKHIDIAIVAVKVNIEIDGRQHQNSKQALADLKRTYYSFKKGYVTLRIPNILVRNFHTRAETARFINLLLRESGEHINQED
jgi:hypothetical protein